MGLTSWTGNNLRAPDVSITKNYLNHEELETLNLIVAMYLDFAELQALSRKPMYMKDWIAKLDDFLRTSDRDILTHAGKISHQIALDKAKAEYAKYRQQLNELLSPVEKHFIEAINKEVNQIDSTSPRKSSKKRKSS